MSKIRFAVVEDEQLYLDDRCENLDELKNECDVEVVIKAHNAEEFFAEYRKNPDNVDALILDIDLTGSYTGLQIAEKVLKPSLFVSGYNAKYLNNIEDLSDRIDVVMHVTKPMSDEKFKNKVRDFCNEIRMHQKFNNQILPFEREGMPVSIPASDIVFLESIPDGSNNKMIYFKNSNWKNILRDIYSPEIGSIWVAPNGIWNNSFAHNKDKDDIHPSVIGRVYDENRKIMISS